jgi:hypothetical protein
MLPIHNGLKQGNSLLPLVFNLALEYATKNVGLKLIGTHQILVHVDNVNLLEATQIP